MTTANQTSSEPGELDALIALALGEHQAGRLAEAAAAYRKILALRPDIAEAYNNLGNVLLGQGNFDEAVAQFERAVALKPDFAEAINNLGFGYQCQKRLDEAAAQYEHAVTTKPDFFQAYNNLGNVLRDQGKLDLAAARYQQAIALRPDCVDAHFSLGNVLAMQGNLDEAAAHFSHALALVPDHADTHYNLGNVLKEQGKLNDAVASYERAVAIKPDHFQAYNNLGNVLRDQGKVDQAVARYRQAADLRPDLADAYYNLGNVVLDQGKVDEAAAHYKHALALRPELAEAQMSLATCYLTEGDYERGWPAYEARLRIPGFVPQTNIPRWTGEPLAGRSILLLSEPGLGNMLLFVRFSRALKQQGARVVLACQPALGRLLASDPDLDELFILGSAGELPHCDFCIPLLSVPGALGTIAATIPREVPYLSADPQLTAKWGAELTGIGGFKIGIVWQGSRDYHLDRWRSIPLAQFAPLARLPGVRLISLQKGFGSEQAALVDFPVLDLSSRLDEAAGPFMDTAAVIRNLDLVVTADTAIAHLAGALGAPVWVALQFSPYWLWLRDRDDSPWYPTMRLFRQTAIGQWSDVFKRISKAVPPRHTETETETFLL